jgi:Bacterial cell division membrane protein
VDRRTLKNLDFLFIFVTCLLLIASLLILSTASFNVLESDPLHYVKSQAIWIMIGIGIATLIAVIDYEKWRTYRWWIYGFNITLLLAVIFWGTKEMGQFVG